MWRLAAFLCITGQEIENLCVLHCWSDKKSTSIVISALRNWNGHLSQATELLKHYAKGLLLSVGDVFSSTGVWQFFTELQFFRRFPALTRAQLHTMDQILKVFHFSDIKMHSVCTLLTINYHQTCLQHIKQGLCMLLKFGWSSQMTAWMSLPKQTFDKTGSYWLYLNSQFFSYMCDFHCI